MNIFIGDSRDKFRRCYFSPSYPYRVGDTETFVEDKQVVADWIRKWQNLESDDARITVAIYGNYGNKYRNSSRQFFEYEHANQ